MSTTDTEKCADGHHCDNGSVCVPNPVDENNYYCDCDEAGDDTHAFEGLYCEHKSTVVCSSQHHKRPTSFCTNGGTCTKKGSKHNGHFACDCPHGFKGAYCQFSTAVPDDWPTMQLSSAQATVQTDSSGLGTGPIVVIVLAAFAMVGAIAYFVVRRSHRQSSTEPIETPEITMAGSAEGVSLPHPDEVRQSVAEGVGSPSRPTHVSPKVQQGDTEEQEMEEVDMDGDENGII